jgi:TPR repeat protein
MFNWPTEKEQIALVCVKTFCLFLASLLYLCIFAAPVFSNSQCFEVLTGDRVAAAQVCEEECLNGNATSCFSLGVLLIANSNASSTLDSQSAMQRACDLGNCRACVAINENQDICSGAFADRTRALERLVISCNNGDGASCRSVAGHYFTNQENSEDQALAKNFLTHGCQLGDSRSCDLLNLLP